MFKATRCHLRLFQNNDILFDQLGTKNRHVPNKYVVVFHVRYYTKQPGVDQGYALTDFAEMAHVLVVDTQRYESNPRFCMNLRAKLDKFNVPGRYQELALCPAISNLAKRMQDDPRNADKDWMGMVVAIDMFDTAAARTVPRFSCIRGLEKIRVGKDWDVKGVDACAICLMEPCAGCEFACLPCSHAFHYLCLIRLLQESSVHALCPLCRRPFTVLTDSAIMHLRILILCSNKLVIMLC